MQINNSSDFSGAHPGARRPNAPRRILIVDDHAIVREGLKQLINEQPGLEVCAEAETVLQARSAVDDFHPEAVITDISLGKDDGIGLVKDLRRTHPKLPILVLSMHDEMLYAERMLSLGANGYVMKRAPGSELLGALRTVINGGVHLSATMSSHLVRHLAMNGPATTGSLGNAGNNLSNRELQVLNLLGQGISTRGAALALHLSIKTVESHRQRLKQKLNLNTGTQLLRFALTWYGESTPGPSQPMDVTCSAI